MTLQPYGHPFAAFGMLADVFDLYVAGPMQQIVGEALRPKDQQDPRRVEESKAALDKTNAWPSDRIGTGWANGGSFSMADPRLEAIDMPFDGKRMIFGGFQTMVES
jgi:hypothetical protein